MLERIWKADSQLRPLFHQGPLIKVTVNNIITIVAKWNHEKKSRLQVNVIHALAVVRGCQRAVDHKECKSRRTCNLYRDPNNKKKREKNVCGGSRQQEEYYFSYSNNCNIPCIDNCSPLGAFLPFVVPEQSYILQIITGIFNTSRLRLSYLFYIPV